MLNKKKFQVIFLLISIISYLIFKIFTIAPGFSDENIYLLMSKYVSKGYLPYIDFNFVHPPIQIFLIGSLFRIFGASFIIVKIFMLSISVANILLLFLISKKLLKEGLISSIFFIFSPVFLIFSDQSNGMWEALFFYLLSLYLYLNNKKIFSSFFFSFSVYLRYLLILLFPTFLILENDRKFKKFFISSLSFSFLFLLLFLFSFGKNFIDQTILFQINSRFFYHNLPKDIYQFLNFGIFFILIFLISLFLSYENKNKKILYLSLYSIFYSLFILSLFKTLIYHYFLPTLPFCALLASYSFYNGKEFIKVTLFLILLLSILHNIPTFEFYSGGLSTKLIFEITEYTNSTLEKSDRIFGESSVTDYISFVTEIPIVNNYLDSYIDYLRYIQEEKVIETLEKEKPKIIIDQENYLSSNPKFYNYIHKNYYLEKVFGQQLKYYIYRRKT